MSSRTITANLQQPLTNLD